MLGKTGVEHINEIALSSEDMKDIAAVQKLWDEANTALEALRNNMAAMFVIGKAEA